MSCHGLPSWDLPLGWVSPLAPPDGPEEPVLGPHRLSYSRELVTPEVTPAEGSGSGEEAKANPLNQPDQLNPLC